MLSGVVVANGRSGYCLFGIVMIIKVIVLLLAIYPLSSFGACEALYHDVREMAVVGNSDTELQYKMVVDEYIRKYRRDYRPEIFFDRAEDYLAKTAVENDDVERKRRRDRASKLLSRFYHYDESIKIALMELAGQKYSPAFYCLGFVYERGIGTKVNYVEAWAWFMTAFSVDGIYAKSHLTRVWKQLSTQEEAAAKILAEHYIREYTEIPNTPSVTILQ